MLAGIFALMAALDAICYWRPLAVFDESLAAWLRIEGVHSEYVQLGDFRIHYLTGGQGEPLVLVHGLAGRAENWALLMPGLMHHGRKVYALDLLGFGRSDRPDVDYSIALQTRMLDQFFTAQNLARADLGGWSMGGWVALKFALAHPERVRRLFVADSAGLYFRPAFNLGLFQPTTVSQAQELLALLTPEGKRLPRFVARDYLRRLASTRWVVARASRSMLEGDDLVDGKLGALPMPVLIIWGKLDAIIPVECGGRLQRQIPQSRLDVFDGCGHLAPGECRDRVLPEILQFLAADPPLGGGSREFQ